MFFPADIQSDKNFAESGEFESAWNPDFLPESCVDNLRAEGYFSANWPKPPRGASGASIGKIVEPENNA